MKLGRFYIEFLLVSCIEYLPLGMAQPRLYFMLEWVTIFPLLQNSLSSEQVSTVQSAGSSVHWSVSVSSFVNLSTVVTVF